MIPLFFTSTDNLRICQAFLKTERQEFQLATLEMLLGSKSQSIANVWVLKCCLDGVDKLIDVITTLHFQDQIFLGNLELTKVEHILFLWYLAVFDYGGVWCLAKADEEGPSGHIHLLEYWP